MLAEAMRPINKPTTRENSFTPHSQEATKLRGYVCKSSRPDLRTVSSLFEVLLQSSRDNWLSFLSVIFFFLRMYMSLDRSFGSEEEVLSVQ